MTKRIPLIARDLKQLYTGFLIAAVALFIVCSFLTEFNVMTLIANGDAFWEFITQDFLPPALPKASRIPGVLDSVVVTLALAMSSTTIAAILAFFVSLFGSEKVSPFPRFAKVVRGFATFLRNIPALVWAFILFSSLGIGTGVGFVALCITSFAFMVRAFVETMEDVSQDCVESLQAVVKGDVDVAPISDQILASEIANGNASESDVKIIHESGAIPAEAMVVAEHVDQKTRDLLTEFLTSYDNEQYFTDVIKVPGARFIECDMSDYQEIIELNRIINEF